MAVKLLVLVCCVISAVLCTDEKYSGKYDNINLKEILENRRLLMAHFECVMETGKCTPEGKELKDHLQDAIETGCSKCTEPQKEGTYTVVDHLIQHEPEMWNKLCEKYDPTGKWRKTYEEQAKERGIIIPH